MEHLSNDPKDHPNQNEYSHKLSLKQDIPDIRISRVWQKVNGNWNKSMIGTSQAKVIENKYKHQKKEIQKSGIVRVTVRDMSRKANQLSEIIWDYNRVHQVYQLHQNRLVSPYEWCLLKFPKTNTLAHGLVLQCSGYHYCSYQLWTQLLRKVQILLKECQRFVMVRISDNGPRWKWG